MKKQHLEKAIQLRLSGKSLNEISHILGIAKSTASLWLHDIVISETAKKILDDKNPAINNTLAQTFSRERKITIHKSRRLQYQQEGMQKAKKGELLHQAGCMLYWAEGSKNRNTLKFTNTDHNMLLLFYKFLTESLQITKDQIYINIQYHEGNEDDIKDFWNQKLGLFIHGLRVIKPRGGSKKNRYPFGIVTIQVRKSTQYCQHIYGAIQTYASFNENYCLD